MPPLTDRANLETDDADRMEFGEKICPISVVGNSSPSYLAMLQHLCDLLNAAFQMAPIAAERHVEQFGGQFLRWRWLDIGVIDGPIELDILWRCIERFGCIQQQLAQCGNPFILAAAKCSIVQRI